jgi:pimeloyl-ACP methyl ester carboxylesterase
MARIALASDRVEGSRAERTVFFLHGILGSGANLRAVAKRFVEACPTYSATLVDLRGHGRSPKATTGGSITEAAEDLVELASSTSRPPLAAIVGHSFGGKVALEAMRLHGGLAHVMPIDSNPGARPPLTGGDSAPAVLETIDSLPPTFATKRDFVDAVQAKHGRTIAQWLGMSTEETAGEVRFALDLAEIRRLLADYFARDLWSVVEDPPGDGSVHVVIGARSSAFSAAERQRCAEIAARNPRVTVDLLDADHWVHVDAPGALQRVLVERLGGAS